MLWTCLKCGLKQFERCAYFYPFYTYILLAVSAWKSQKGFRRAGTKTIEDTNFSPTSWCGSTEIMNVWLPLGMHNPKSHVHVIFFFNTGLYCVRHTKDLQGGDIKLCMNSDGQEISGAVWMAVKGRQKHTWVTIPGLWSWYIQYCFQTRVDMMKSQLLCITSLLKRTTKHEAS